MAMFSGWHRADGVAAQAQPASWSTNGPGRTRAYFQCLHVLRSTGDAGFCVVVVAGKNGTLVADLAIGGSFEEAYVMQTDHQSSRSTCEYRLRGGPMEHGFPDYLCIQEDLYHRYPQQQVAVILKGQRSRLGTHIVEIYGPQ